MRVPFSDKPANDCYFCQETYVYAKKKKNTSKCFEDWFSTGLKVSDVIVNISKYAKNNFWK